MSDTEPLPPWDSLEVGPIANPAFDYLKAEHISDFIARAEAEPPFRWLWEPFVPDRGSVFAVAPPGTGKTWFSLKTAKEAASRGRTVLFVEEEGSARGLMERLKAIGFDPNWPVYLIHRRGLRVDDEETLARLVSLVQGEDAPLVVMDPLVTLFLGDENSAKDCVGLTRRLNLLLEANRKTLLLVVHHSSKTASRDDSGGAPVYTARGSSQLSGWFDQTLNLSPIVREEGEIREPGVVEFAVDVAKCREAEQSRGKVDIQIRLGTGETTAVPRKQRQREEFQALVLGTLVNGPLTGNEIVTAIGGKRTTVLKTITEMVSGGTLRRRLDKRLERAVPP